MTSSSGGQNGPEALASPAPPEPPAAPPPAAAEPADDTAAPAPASAELPPPPPPPPAEPSPSTATAAMAAGAADATSAAGPIPSTPQPRTAGDPFMHPAPSTPPSNPNGIALNNPNTLTAGLEDPFYQPMQAVADAQTLDATQPQDMDHPMTDAPMQPLDFAVMQSHLTTPVQQRAPDNMDMMGTQNFAPSTPYTPANIANLDSRAYMMLLASLAQRPNSRPNSMHPPSIVTPSQVTLPDHMPVAMEAMVHPTHSENNPEKSLEAFARIEFADSVFQMTTYSVIIGRDQRALVQARRDEKREEEYQRQKEENESKGLPPPEIKETRTRFSKSYVSEEGGMLGPESEGSEENGRSAKRRKTSTNGSSQHELNEAQENMVSNRQYVSHTPGAAMLDLARLRPSPWHVAFLGIHSPGPNIASKTKAISREHLKIQYNQAEGVFEAIPLHKNGFFCEDVHHKSGKVVLRSNDRLQIKDVDFRFVINGVKPGRTGAEAEEEASAPAKVSKKRSHGGKEMSFDFESAHGNGEVQDTSDDLSELASPPELSDFGEEEEEAEPEQAEREEPEQEPEKAVAEPTIVGTQHEAIPEELQHLMPQIPKKRGPGRPPKNGIMSKREQRLLKKQQQEMARKTLPQAPPAEPPIKRKVGRPRKHPLPEGEERPEKRKYKPRKPKEDGAEGSDAERRAREKKDKKARPKSPPLQLNIEDYTEEQLQKPNKNYGVLIDETLTAGPPEGYTLKQIYKRITERYPWFYFHTETKGWESSVRHNLIGNDAFRKDESTNLWSRVPGVELDAGKKRKASSPDRSMTAQAYGHYQYPYNAAQQHMAPYPPAQAAPGYPVPGYNPQQAQPPPPPIQPYGASTSPPAPVQPGQPVASQPPAPAQLPGYGPPPAPARPQLGGPQPASYSSPYASRPPPPAHIPVKAEDVKPPTPGMPHQPSPAMAPGVSPAMPGPAPATPHAASPPKPPAAATPAPAATPSRPVIDPRTLQAVVKLKDGLIENLTKASHPQAQAVVMSAVNRCMGLKKEATENEKMEEICMKGLSQLIEGVGKSQSPTPGGSQTPDTKASVFEPKVLQSLVGLKEASVKALKSRLGEAKAEMVALSSIDRVLGLARASIVPPPSDLEGVEQSLMKSIRQLLTGMNQILPDSPDYPKGASASA